MWIGTWVSQKPFMGGRLHYFGYGFGKSLFKTVCNARGLLLTSSVAFATIVHVARLMSLSPEEESMEPRYYLMTFGPDVPADHVDNVVNALVSRCGAKVERYNPERTRIADVLPAMPAPIALPIAQPSTTPSAPAVVARPAWADRDPAPAKNGNGLKSYDATLQAWWLRNATTGEGIVDARGTRGHIAAHTWKTKVGGVWYTDAARPLIIAQRMQALQQAR